MANDWIKIRKELNTDPAVISIMDALGLDEYQVIGRLHKLWSWADSHTKDGNVTGVTCNWLDRYIDCEGFTKALLHVTWLSVTEDGISFPNYNKHMSENAKKREKTAERVRRYRERKRNAERNADVTQKTLPEKRREEKNNNHHSDTAISSFNAGGADRPDDDFFKKFGREPEQGPRKVYSREELG